jgi:hypothetical protein
LDAGASATAVPSESEGRGRQPEQSLRAHQFIKNLPSFSAPKRERPPRDNVFDTPTDRSWADQRPFPLVEEVAVSASHEPCSFFCNHTLISYW